MADDLVGRLSEDPARAAVLLDVDGTLAPIVERPEDARVPDEARRELAPEAGDWADALVSFAGGVDWPAERKPLSLTFHFRRVADEAAARAYLTRVADAAEAEGLVPRWGRMVLEIRPPVDADKGTAVRALVTRAGVSRALYAGDDTTDVDAFHGLDELELGVRVAVDSGEAPPDLVAAADLVVDGTAGVLALLRAL